MEAEKWLQPRDRKSLVAFGGGNLPVPIFLPGLISPGALFLKSLMQHPPLAEPRWIVAKLDELMAALDAFVLTAYLTDKPKKGILLWPKP